MINNIISLIRKRLDDHRRYHRALADIEALTTRELIDMGADRTELEQGAYRQVYG